MLSDMRRSHAYLLNTLLYSLIFETTTASATVTPRYLQSAVYDGENDRVIFAGGSTAGANVSSDVYTLDLSTKVERSKMNFTILPSLSTAVADAAAVIDDNGSVYVLGGLQSACPSSLTTQVYSENATAWKSASSKGAVPAARQGAGAAFVNDKIFYFGGKSLDVCSSSQYYYNTLYSVDTTTLNWTLATSSSPPVAEAGMSMSASGAGEFLLIGGEAVSSSSTASWVGMTQFAQYSANSSSWSYLSSDSSSLSIASRTGHTAVSNGTHTYVLGGSIGSTVSKPTFLVMSEEASSLNVTAADTSSNSSIPSASLYGHSAILTKNGIMVVAFGLVGSSNSSTFNTAVYLYDTYKNEWIDTYDPAANAPSKVSAKGSLALGSIVAIVVVPLIFVTLGLILLLTIRKRRQDRQKRQRAFPVNRLGTFSPDEDEHDFDGKPTLPMMTEKGRREHLPPWAAMHACQARSTVHTADQLVSISTPDPISEKSDRQIRDYDIQDVQFAYPASPRNMTFTAPRLQLRVVNPDAGSARNSFDVSRTMPELIETSRSGLTTSVPLTITNEDDLELLRTKLSNSPMIGDIDNQLAGLGLVIREDTVHVTATGEMQRVRTISRQKSRRSVGKYNQATPPRLSIVSDLSSSLDLDSVLAVGASLSPIPAHSFRDYSPEQSAYSPYLDSPRSSHHGSPVHRQRSILDRQSNSHSPIQLPSPTKRRASGSSSTSRTGLLDPWPSLKVKRDNS